MRTSTLFVVLFTGAAFAQEPAPRQPIVPSAPADAVADDEASPLDPSAAAAPAEAVAAPAPAPAPLKLGLEALGGRFELGSYGRIGVGSDLRGQLGKSANVVSHGPRLIEEGYAELELRREDEFGPVRSRVVSTVAFFAPFFHFSGSIDQHIALRNLYAEAAIHGFSAWVGSRMYRGDDVYLLDFWPLDNLNTVGGGVAYDFGQGTRVQLHGGMQRLDQPTQHQLVWSDNPIGQGAVSVTRLDRPRMIESLKLTHTWQGDAFGLRASLYGEAHELSGGVQRDVDTGDESVLPADWGVMVGGQVSVWTPKNLFAHLWVRQSAGLAVYDALTSPATVANDRTTRGARSTRLALAGGWELGPVGLLFGAYLDLVRDAGISQVTAQKYDEGALVVRTQWAASKYFGVAAEASHQRRTYALVDPRTGGLRSGGVTQLGLMPYFSPLGPALFSRPQLRLVYALSLRDAGARSFYAVDDPAASRGVEHYVGVNVEWWFNTTTYPVR